MILYLVWDSSRFETWGENNLIVKHLLNTCINLWLIKKKSFFLTLPPPRFNYLMVMKGQPILEEDFDN